jgi:hypothetical protein
MCWGFSFARARAPCPLLAHSGHAVLLPSCPLSGVKLPRLPLGCAAANDPKRTLGNPITRSPRRPARAASRAPRIFARLSVPCAHTYLLVFDRRNCRNCGDADDLLYRSLTVTDPQRRNGHACTSVGYFLVLDNGRRGLLWGRVTSDTGAASKASRLRATSGHQVCVPL